LNLDSDAQNDVNSSWSLQPNNYQMILAMIALLLHHAIAIIAITN